MCACILHIQHKHVQKLERVLDSALSLLLHHAMHMVVTATAILPAHFIMIAAMMLQSKSVCCKSQQKNFALHVSTLCGCVYLPQQLLYYCDTCIPYSSQCLHVCIIICKQQCYDQPIIIHVHNIHNLSYKTEMCDRSTNSSFA